MKEIYLLPNKASKLLKTLAGELKKMNVQQSTVPNTESIGIVENEEQYLAMRKTSIGTIVWISDSPQTVHPNTSVHSGKDLYALRIFIADLAFNS